MTTQTLPGQSIHRYRVAVLLLAIALFAALVAAAALAAQALSERGDAGVQSGTAPVTVIDPPATLPGDAACIDGPVHHC